jgi:hypothetical protein
LNRCGVVLVRGGDSDIAGFEALTSRFCGQFHHAGARHALRQSEGDGFTTGVSPRNFILFGHSEGHYRPSLVLPDVCFFKCVVPPSVAGGETTLVDGVELLSRLPPALVRRFEDQGVIYEFSWEPARWQAEFGVTDEAGLKAFLARFPGARYTLSGGLLHMFYAAPALSRLHDGAAAFSNGILAHLPGVEHPRYEGRPVYARPSNRVYFGDGELIPNDVINTLIDAHDTVLYRHRWQANDLLIVDNTRYMHGREMTVEPCERVLISRFGRFKETTSPP